MFISEALNINEKGHLTIGGVDSVDIANEFGTPVYVMDEDLIRNNCQLYFKSIKKACGENGTALYASKAFSCLYVLKIAAEEGMGLDVVSGGELYTAHKAGFPMDKVYFHGNNKTKDEIELAIKLGVGHFVVDNKYELYNINEISEKYNKVSGVLFRIKPGVDAHTHDFIRTGQIDSKFGFALETGEAEEIISEALKCKNISIKGLHCHIGSQIFEVKPFIHAAEIMIDFIKTISEKFSIEIDELNLGGGFGIQYLDSDDPIGYDKYIGEVMTVVKEKTKEYNLKMPKMILEPGRSLVGTAGITLYKVGCVKDIPNVRKYVSVDGGMADNPRYIMYNAPYTALIADRADDKNTQTVTIAGKCCESGDILIKNADMPDIKVGDTLAVLSTGAYNYSMSSNYNRIPKPPVVMITNGKPHVIVKRETYEDIIRNDVL